MEASLCIDVFSCQFLNPLQFYSNCFYQALDNCNLHSIKDSYCSVHPYHNPISNDYPEIIIEHREDETCDNTFLYGLTKFCGNTKGIGER